MYAPTMPLKPPTMCTAPQPAKSTMPLPNSGMPVLRAALSQPAPLHSQCATTGYTNAVSIRLYVT